MVRLLVFYSPDSVIFDFIGFVDDSLSRTSDNGPSVTLSTLAAHEFDSYDAAYDYSLGFPPEYGFLEQFVTCYNFEF